MDVADAVTALVAPHPAVSRIKLAGSRAEGRAHERSDWDFRVETSDFARVAEAAPRLLAPLDPLVQQWDRLSEFQCLMLILRGPTKVDLLFPEEPHVAEPPWTPTAENLRELDAHFWDWLLWLGAKEAGGHTALVESELVKLFDHLLRPLGAEVRPASIADVLRIYRIELRRAEERLGASVDRELEAAVAPALGPVEPAK